MDSDLELLCQSCSLCCDGSLFGRVDLEPDEVEPARRRGLRVIQSGRAFEQPCTALASEGPSGRSCSVYEARPLSCRRFTCRLYERHRLEGGPIEERLAVVARARALIALAREGGDHAELQQLLEESFAHARRAQE
jgi:Fe-S-cluster containining protein